MGVMDVVDLEIAQLLTSEVACDGSAIDAHILVIQATARALITKITRNNIPHN